jgi:acyl-CoA reductase-like NAD-dependent aldehyde dehydrogenase
MSGNGTTNYSFVAGNAMPSALHTGTNSGMITNGMQSRSIGGKRRSVSKRKRGGGFEPPTQKEVDDAEAAAKKAEIDATPTDSNRIQGETLEIRKRIATNLRAKADDLSDRYVKENQSNTTVESNNGGKKRKSHKNRKTSRKTKKWFGLF